MSRKIQSNRQPDFFDRSVMPTRTEATTLDAITTLLLTAPCESGVDM